MANSVHLLGRIASDIEFGYTQNTQLAVAKFSVALGRGRDKDGNDRGADFPRVIVWGKQAEFVDKYFRKGKGIYIQGHITTGSYKDRDGNTRYTTDVTADRVEFAYDTEPQKSNSVAPGPGFKDCQSSNPEQMDMDDYPDSFQATDDSVPF